MKWLVGQKTIEYVQLAKNTYKVNTDWFDEVVDGKPIDAEYWQIDYIDSLLPRTALSIIEQDIISNKIFEKGFSKQEAEEIIIQLKQSEVKTDPRDQYKDFVKNGMFN